MDKWIQIERTTELDLVGLDVQVRKAWRLVDENGVTLGEIQPHQYFRIYVLDIEGIPSSVNGHRIRPHTATNKAEAALLITQCQNKRAKYNKMIKVLKEMNDEVL